MSGASGQEGEERAPGAPPTLLVLDSGLGGLSVLAPLRALLPTARFVYAADDAAFPYGALGPGALVARVLSVVGALTARHAPDLVVVACNTASTLVLAPLRAALACPVVGTVPAIKPAAALTRSGMVTVLGTPGTVRRDYTHDLVIEHAPRARVTLVGAPNLAAMAEGELRGDPAGDAVLAAEIAPAFVERDGARTDAVVLACTHYPLLLARLERLAPWPVTFVDPGPAVARRAAALLGARGAGEGPPRADGLAVFTGAPPGPVLAAALEARGLPAWEVLPIA